MTANIQLKACFTDTHSFQSGMFTGTNNQLKANYIYIYIINLKANYTNLRNPWKCTLQ